MLRSADVLVNYVPLSEVTITTGFEFNELAAELDKDKARIVERDSTETITIRRHEELLNEIKQCQAEEIGVWKETSAGNADNLISNAVAAKEVCLEMSVERNLIWSRFEEHVPTHAEPGKCQRRTKGNVDGSLGKSLRASQEWSLN